MNRQARLSLASKGFLSAAVVMLIMGAERPLSQPLSRRNRIPRNESVCTTLNLLSSCEPDKNRKSSIIARRLPSSAGCSEQRRGRASEPAGMRNNNRCRSD